jgi:hypothetical protein
MVFKNATMLFEIDKYRQVQKVFGQTMAACLRLKAKVRSK